MAGKRYLWIDWMKVIGIYFIIVGHLFPNESPFIYTFNVPLFFIISGFLNKVDNDSVAFFTKQKERLLIPMVIMFSVCFVYDIIWSLITNSLTLSILYRPFYAATGFVFYDGDYRALRALWFLYTLFLIKILANYFSKKALIFFSIIGILASLILNYNHIDMWPNSFVNVCLSIPFFTFGLFLKHGKSLNFIQDNEWLCYVIIPITLVLVIWISHFNGAPWMYKNEFGNNIILFLFLGGLSFYLVYCISLLLSHYIPEKAWIKTLSSGTIVILGFHQILLSFYPYFHISHNCVKYAYSLVVLLLFIPLIKLCFIKIPILIGNRS